MTLDNISPSQLYGNLALPEGTRSIRLLDLDGTTGTEDASNDSAPLTARLRVARLESSPSFAALSYVWGEKAAPSHTILCRPHNYRIEITSNCHAALCAIRRRFGAVTLWVDSVCINQADEAEKARQIPLMREIYSWAEATYVWLGPADEESYQAMDVLTHLASWMAPIPLGRLAAKSERGRGDVAGGLGRKMVRGVVRQIKERLRWRRLEHVDPTCIDRLLGRSWAQRVWTFQEIVLSVAPIFLCGDRCISWEDVVSGVYEFKREEDSLGGYSSVALNRWKSIIDLWLCLPRDADWNGETWREVLRGETSFEDHIKTILTNHAVFVQRLRRFTRVIAYLQLALGLALAVSWVVLLSKNKLSDVALGLLFLAIGFLVLSGAGTYFFLDPALLVGYPHTEFLRHTRERLPAREWQALVAIRVALLERASSIPHDRSFGLSGILSSFGVAVPVPDYSQPLGETYHCLFRSLLAWQPRAVALLIDGGSPSLPDTPTWVPHWGTTRPASWLVSRYQMGSYMPLISSFEGMEPLQCSLDATGRRLSISGHKRGVVSFRTHLNPGTRGRAAAATSSHVPPSVAAAFAWLNHIRKHCPTPHDARAWCDDDLVAAFCVLRGLTPERKHPHAPTLHAWLDGLCYNIPSDQGKRFQQFRDCYEEWLLRHETAERAWGCARYDAGHREFFLDMVESVADDGRCLLMMDSGLAGSGPVDVRCGDEVFSLRGVPAPMILRPTGEGAYTVVGAVLVHGLMQGEGLTQGSFSETVELV